MTVIINVVLWLDVRDPILKRLDRLVFKVILAMLVEVLVVMVDLTFVLISSFKELCQTTVSIAFELVKSIILFLTTEISMKTFQLTSILVSA